MEWSGLHPRRVGEKLGVEYITTMARPDDSVTDERIFGGGNGRIYPPDAHSAVTPIRYSWLEDTN